MYSRKSISYQNPFHRQRGPSALVILAWTFCVTMVLVIVGGFVLMSYAMGYRSHPPRNPVPVISAGGGIVPLPPGTWRAHSVSGGIHGDGYDWYHQRTVPGHAVEVVALLRQKHLPELDLKETEAFWNDHGSAPRWWTKPSGKIVRFSALKGTWTILIGVDTGDIYVEHGRY